jgi:phage baseplate assembly protein W
MDITLNKGDLSILVVEDKKYDVDIEEYKTTLKKLIDRAIKTKLGDLGIVTIKDGVEIVDYGYGNAIFFELSEPLTISWLSRARQHITSALSFLPNTVEVLSVQVSPQSSNTVNINVIIRFNNETINSIVTLYI